MANPPQVGNLDAGDTKFEPGNRITLTSDGTGTKGELVKFAADATVTPTTASADDWVGVLHETPDADGDNVTVIVGGIVVMTADGAVDAGEILEPSSSTDGQVVAAGTGRYQAVDEGGTATYNLQLGQMQALMDATDGDLFVGRLP